MNSNSSWAVRLRQRSALLRVVAFVPILLVLSLILHQAGAFGQGGPSLVLGLIASLWVVGILILLLDRESPGKYWAVPLLLSITFPGLAVWYDWWTFDRWRTAGESPHLGATVVLNFLLFGAFVALVLSTRPDRCPRCGHWALIPLPRFRRLGDRAAKTRWCGSCGAQYWRQGKGVWQKERRMTWIDALDRATRPGVEPGTSAIPRPRGLRADRPASSGDVS
ncbi:hypothetical protein ACYOEI_20170 [Singulisphaera rosea]